MKHSIQARFQASLWGALLLLLAGLLPWSGFAAPKPVQAEAVGACTAGKFCVFLPGLMGSSPSGDIVLSGIEVTQAIQDSSNSVPLVAGKSTMLRIYAVTMGKSQPLSNIKVSVTARTSGNLSLNQSPAAFSSTIPLSTSRADYRSTINFQLPASWLTGTVDLTIRLDPDNTLAESNESNNGTTKRLVFNAVPPLQVKIVPIQYTNTSTGRTYAAPTQDTFSSWITRTYPISRLDISWHVPFLFMGDLSKVEDFNRLLNDITALKLFDKAPTMQVYYGLIPASTWFSGGVAGMGWIGSRSAIGLEYSDKTAQIVAHELGHNLGMGHTPCGIPNGSDPNYPYRDGSIGQFGLDVVNGTLYPPESSKDVMSYCDPKWISDYTYKVLFNNQVMKGEALALNKIDSNPALSLSQRSLLVRAEIHPDGARLFPAYVLPEAVGELPEAGEYRAQVVGQNGESLVEMPVTAYATGEFNEYPVLGINAMIPLPDQPAASLRLLKDGQVLAEQPLRIAVKDKSASGLAVEPSGSSFKLRWTEGSHPALVRYSADGGSTWTTLAVDASGSELNLLSPDAAAPGGIYEIIEAGTWQ